MTQHKPLALIAGAGPGLGQALMRHFAAEGYTCAGLKRTLPQDTQGLNLHAVDLTDAEQVQSTIQTLIEQHGPPKVVIHNPAHLVISAFSETTLQDYEQSWRSMFLSAVILAQSVMQPMVRAGGGTFLVSGATASLRGGARFSAFASAKFALRGLTQSLAREYQPAGVHVAHIILDGIVDSERSRDLHSMDPNRMMKPEDIARVYGQLVQQPSSTWSHEIDLRPLCEKF